MLAWLPRKVMCVMGEILILLARKVLWVQPKPAENTAAAAAVELSSPLFMGSFRGRGCEKPPIDFLGGNSRTPSTFPPLTIHQL